MCNALVSLPCRPRKTIATPKNPNSAHHAGVGVWLAGSSSFARGMRFALGGALVTRVQAATSECGRGFGVLPPDGAPSGKQSTNRRRPASQGQPLERQPRSRRAARDAANLERRSRHMLRVAGTGTGAGQADTPLPAAGGGAVATSIGGGGAYSQASNLPVYTQHACLRCIGLPIRSAPLHANRFAPPPPCT